MTTALNTITENTGLVNYDEAFAHLAETTRKTLVSASGNFISTKDKIFTLPDGQVNTKLECVVLAFNRVNQLMPPYNPTGDNTTKCWAMGIDANNLIPDPRSRDLQANSCNECPMNAFGSARGGKGKACSNIYRLAVIPPDANDNSPIWLLKVTPTALKRWKLYHDLCERGAASGFRRVITEISFDMNQTYPTLMFKALEPFNKPALILSLIPNANEALLTEPSIAD